MIVEQVVCDGCGAIKGEANHWFAVEEPNFPVTTLGIWPIERSPDSTSMKHFCGVQCTLKHAAAQMEKMQ